MTKSLALTILALASVCPAGAEITLQIYPNNDLTPPMPLTISGNASTVGFGFDLQNDNIGWILVEGVNLVPNPGTSLGTWNDLLTPSLTDAIAPGADLSETWIQGTQGLGEFAFAYSSMAYAGPPPFTIELQYGIYDSDPFTDPGAMLIGMDGQALDSSSVQFNVSAPSGMSTPEPSTLWLVFGGAAFLMPRRRKIAWWRNPDYSCPEGRTIA